jgi:hypothetical protein
MASRNLTLALPEELLERSRRYATAQGTTLNQLVRNELEKLTGHPPGSRARHLIEIARSAKIRSSRPWRREDLYDR